MRKLNGLTIRALTLTLLLGGLPSVGKSASETGAAFLKIPIGAQMVGLGQAGTALTRGVQSLNWNPAGAMHAPLHNGVRKMAFSYSHQELFLDSDLDHVGLIVPSHPLSHKFSWGFSLTRLSHPDQQGRAADRSKTGNFSASDLAVGTALAFQIKPVTVGTQIKFIQQDLGTNQAQGVAFDIGFLAPTPVSKLSLGGAVRNAGPKMKFVDERFDLPLTASLGLAYQLIPTLNIGLDVYSRPYQDQVSLALGAEMKAVETITLRAGYLAKVAETLNNTQSAETNRGNIGGLEGLTSGLGLNIDQFSLDYALSQFGELGLTHSLTLTTMFGGEQLADTNNRLDLNPDDRKDPSLDQPDLRRTIVIFELMSSTKGWWE